MRAAVAVSALLVLAACGGDVTGPDFGPPLDFGVDAALDAGPRDAGPHDAATDAAPDAARDLGMDAHVVDLGTDLGPHDMGRPCEMWDATGVDWGPLPDASPPFETLDLGVAPDGDIGYCPPVSPMPGFVNGCPEYLGCLAELDASTGLTYDGFAEPLFQTYCTMCHSSTLVTGPERHYAPPGYDWDVRAAVYTYLPRIRIVAGLANSMPFDRPCLLSCDRRRELVTWIDEGAP